MCLMILLIQKEENPPVQKTNPPINTKSIDDDSFFGDTKDFLKEDPFDDVAADVIHDVTNDVIGEKNVAEDPWPDCENNIAGIVC